MSKHQKNEHKGLAQQQTQNLTATSLPPARTASEARADGGQEAAEPWAVGQAPASVENEKGAPPSNTAPYNCNSGDGFFFKALRWGVDSLYLSYPGELSQESDARLKALKLLAQSTDPNEVAKAQLPLGKHVFEVKEKGASLFAYSGEISHQ